MGAYQYVAVDQSGKEHKGVVEGDTPRHVRQLLRERALLPVDITQVAARTKSQRTQTSLRRGISSLELALVTRQLATLLQAGMPLEEALLAVSEQCEKARLKSLVLGVRSKVLEGYTLAAGLEDYPHAFPIVYRATVAAGEQAGQLDRVLEQLADYTESRHTLHQKVSHALIYPIVLTSFSFLIVALMLVYVVPKVVGVFQSTGQPLPVMTRALIGLSSLLEHWWPAFIIGFIAAVLAGRRLLEHEHIRRRVHRWLLATPVVGRVIRGVNTARFTRTLSILSTSGVPIIDALRIGATVVSCLPMRDAVAEASLRVSEGSALGQSLGRSRLFPPMSIHLIASGEQSGKLGKMLERAATHQESEMDSLLDTLLSILEPALIILMGAMVLAIVMAILLPIFQIDQLVG